MGTSTSHSCILCMFKKQYTNGYSSVEQYVWIMLIIKREYIHERTHATLHLETTVACMIHKIQSKCLSLLFFRYTSFLQTLLANNHYSLDRSL